MMSGTTAKSGSVLATSSIDERKPRWMHASTESNAVACMSPDQQRTAIERVLVILNEQLGIASVHQYRKAWERLQWLGVGKGGHSVSIPFNNGVE